MILAFAIYVPRVYHPATRPKRTITLVLKREFIDEIPDQPSYRYNGGFNTDHRDRRDLGRTRISLGSGPLVGREVVRSSGGVSGVYDAAGTRAEIEAIRARIGQPETPVQTLLLKRAATNTPQSAQVTQVSVRPDETGRGLPVNIQVLARPDARFNVVINGVVYGGMTEAGGRQIVKESGGNPADFDWSTAPATQPQPPAQVPLPAAVLNTPINSSGEETMDLGNLLGTLGSAYIQARYQPQVVASPVDYNVGGVNIDPFDIVSPDTGTTLVRPCAKKRRRRRRRLATASDIKDIAALKATMSPSEFKTWLATHPQ